MFSKKATKINEIFTVNLTVTTYLIDDEDFVTFCGLLRKRELYIFKEKRANAMVGYKLFIRKLFISFQKY